MRFCISSMCLTLFCSITILMAESSIQATHPCSLVVLVRGVLILLPNLNVVFLYSRLEILSCRIFEYEVITSINNSSFFKIHYQKGKCVTDISFSKERIKRRYER